VEVDGVTRFQANAGVVLRNYELGANRLSFTVTTPRSTKITTREPASGALSVNIDGHPLKSVVPQGGNITFAIPAGEHDIVQIWK
jgi:hypothetical protein